MSDSLPFSPLTYNELRNRAERAAYEAVGSVDAWHRDGAHGPLHAVQYAAECIAYHDALMDRLARPLEPARPGLALAERR